MFLQTAILLLPVFTTTAGFSSDIKLVIDNDAGADDAMAIFLALIFEKYFYGPQVIALTTTNGNTKEENVYKNNQNILNIAKRRDIPIYRGSKESLLKTPESGNFYGEDGLGDIKIKDNSTSHNITVDLKNGHAVLRLLGLSILNKGLLRIVANGPLTNIALAIKLDPEFIDRLEHLYVGAGHIDSKTDPHPEFNALMDVEAYHIVCQHSKPDKVTFLPLSQVETYLNVSKLWRQDVLGALHTDIIRKQNSFERISLPKLNSWQPLDVANIAVALNIEIVQEFRYAKADIVVCGKEAGFSTYKFVDKEFANTRIAYSLKVEDYKKFLISVFVMGYKSIIDGQK